MAEMILNLPQFMSSAGLKKAHNLLLEIMVHLIAPLFKFPAANLFDVSFHFRFDLRTLNWNRMSLFFLQIWMILRRNGWVSWKYAFSIQQFLSLYFLVLNIIFGQCIKGKNRLRVAAEFFNAEKSTATAASSGYPAERSSTSVTSADSDVMFSDLSPLIYHESECAMSSQVQPQPHFYCPITFYFWNSHMFIFQVHILLPFIPPSEASKFHILFNM